ncbi:bile acid:sodium symporter family protein [Halobaculum sp. EA56]|uniref:bile acid:sodium symporter family protein n=1 Tax=Halobaculum sp. EA56 TaxID=3421648 RepID=UPI003EBEA640
MLRRLAAAVDDYLLAWVLGAVAVGLAVPRLAALKPLSTPLLAVMIGSVSLTLSPARFRGVRGRPLAAVLAVQTAMPLAALALARLLGLPPALAAGFVVLGAVTPELVTPTMTELAGGDTALSTVVLVAVGVATLGIVPAATTTLLAGGVAVDAVPIVRQLLVAVVAPMALAVGLRARFPGRIAPHDDLYPSVSGVMVVLVIGIVAADNAALVLSGEGVLLPVVAGAVALNLAGYAAGWLAGSALGFSAGERVASTLCVGMRDFAVAAALLVAAGFPPAATLPAVVFGVVEMTTSAGLARYWAD